MKDSGTLNVLDKFGAAGALLAAAAAPCCFPLLAVIGAALGLGAFQSWRGYMDYAIQGFALISAAGTLFSFRQHRRAWPLSIGLAGAGLVFFAYYAFYHVGFIYAGLAGLATSSAWSFFATRQKISCCRKVALQSVITCPLCGSQRNETMPTNACLYFYECQSCKTTLRPKSGDCCVFCSYGSVKCPPIQSETETNNDCRNKRHEPMPN